ncbi:2Fe-2S iron-sulfur cluster binding domain-containing protein [Victivallaceae bacterium BBE-744-WT-12]|uniref:2Fe-2S iron-sulfur cluster binding domain-containing protein n=1 Tax=Victivallis lenta TaxID=2606640 RepID=A0A844G805_9BACT|nr:NADH-dependent [FeFe] hydrogenase, group A6 [Victivallis lenta]AVM43306.1 NADH:ubiquinone oxidoreductase [Victivallales bacterium CCUG 44730]MBS1455128.1 2Fe-2S iron-sulfur cluster binding domain-containing protein [Lentisphaeria bacterium]MST98429.1 2Fe-2S iron-sulfur cluster binding domain-containing protein [Victivallis lenta]HBP07607.1 NADH:ubiquinone oxidoreductase [Lentisphaeria bacterium]
MKVNLKINDSPVSVEAGATILEAAELLDIRIPTLCHMKMDCLNFEHRSGSCRVCVVEVKGRPNLAPACSTPVTEGMEVHTNTLRAINARRTILDLLLSDHPKDCLICPKNLDCQLQALAQELGLHHLLYKGEQSTYNRDLSSKAIARDLDKCIMCRRCETACNVIQTVGVLSGVGRGFEAVVAPAGLKPLVETECVFCGQCVQACPVGALTEMDYKYPVWRMLNDPAKTVVVQTAPAVRVAIGEEFGMAPGSVSTGKMVAALRKLGFDKVFDTDFAADLTIMEETTELIERVKSGENLPILTSCCPGWVKFLEHQFPDLIYMPSTAKSPQQMFGAIAKSYYAEKIGVRPEDLIVVSVMPCLAKKYEASREEFSHNGVPDVDIVISTRELADMIREAGIQFSQLEDQEYDSPLGESTGAAVIFGATGGVLEAALRTAADWLAGQDLQEIDFTAVRGIRGIKEATVNIAGIELHVAICSGLGNARKLLNKIQRGEADYQAIEIMACPGGCLNGGGQPYHHGHGQILSKRLEALYRDDKNAPIRKSHQNPSIRKLYAEFLGEPGSHFAHKLLHTHYIARSKK